MRTFYANKRQRYQRTGEQSRSFVSLDFRRASPQALAMAHEFTTSYLKDSSDILRHHKRLAERAMEQAPDEALLATLDPESNSIALIVKHVSGNLRSRWTDFLTSDGEKPSRNRDTEFEDAPTTRAEIMALWEAGWACVFKTFAELVDADLARTIHIRGEAHSVMQAINRQIGHNAYHIGQIVYLAKHLSGPRWQTLTVPRHRSAEFNAKVKSGELSQR